MKKFFFRVRIVLVYPFAPLLAIVGGVMEYWDEYCHEVAQFYREAPKAFKKGSQL